MNRYESESAYRHHEDRTRSRPKARQKARQKTWFHAATALGVFTNIFFMTSIALRSKPHAPPPIVAPMSPVK